MEVEVVKIANYKVDKNKTVQAEIEVFLNGRPTWTQFIGSESEWSYILSNRKVVF